MLASLLIESKKRLLNKKMDNIDKKLLLCLHEVAEMAFFYKKSHDTLEEFEKNAWNSFDYLDKIDLAMYIEEKLNIIIEMDEVDNWDTIKSVKDTIKNEGGKRQ